MNPQKEGLIEIFASDGSFDKGPGKRKNVFYNKAMEVNRDLTIMLLDAIEKKPKLCLDGFGASGIRGIRLSKELGLKAIITDNNPIAVEYIKKNVEHNKAEVEIYKENFFSIVSRKKFDYIDIDPFGSPVPFIDCALYNIKNNGILGVTATDTANLTGTYPKKTIRRYLAKTKKTFAMHETGVRILLGYIARMAAKFDKGTEPLAVLSKDHFYRVFVRIKNGANRANKSLENLGFIENNPFVKGEIGPLWIGNMFSQEILKNLKIKSSFGSKDIITKMSDCWKYEDTMLLFYDTPILAKRYKFHHQPSLENVISILREEGYIAGRTHFSFTGIKTDATLDDVLRACKKSYM